jgi:hypothetical protein
MSQKSLLNDINKHYSVLKEKISKKIELDNDFEYIFTEQNNYHTVEIVLEGQVKIKGEYNIVGMYNIPLSVWYWGWNIAFINKKLIEKLDNIKNFLDSLEENFKDLNGKEAEEIHYLLSNDNFYTTSENIDKLIKLVLYITNAVWCFPIKHTQSNLKKNTDEMDRTDYIIVTKILQYN